MSRPTNRPHTQPRQSRPRPASSKHPRRWPWYAAGLLAGIGIVAIALSASGGQASGVQVVRDPSAVARGAELYSANCASCHGADLYGTDLGPPFLNLIYAPNHHADEAFQRAVAGGVQPHHWGFGPMAPVDGLSRADVALIVEFVRSEQEAAGILRDPSHP